MQYPELNKKFEQLGLPIEYYFGEHIIALFSTLFNYEILFRIWDVVIFE